MFLKFSRSPRAVSLLAATIGLSCGARTSIYTSDTDGPPPIVCSVDLDCDTGDACAQAECREGICVSRPAIVCDDHDACTEDACDAQNGQCSFSPVTLDLDGDGHRSPKPGFAPGAPGACGDDCDDRSASAHPGGREVCDGADNDCNGKVDDGALYGGVRNPVRVASMAFDRANGGGMAFDGKNYGITFSGHDQRWSSYFTSVARDGTTVVPETSLDELNSASYAGSLLYNGRYFASAWADARQDGNYEVYFNRYTSSGEKLGPDLRVSRAPKFSIDPVLAWNGSESIVVWDDSRNEGRGGDDVRLYGQRIAFDGSLIGQDIALTGADTLAERPGIAVGQDRIGVVFSSRVSRTQTHAKFFSTAPDLTRPTPIVDLGGTDVQSPSVVYVGGHYTLLWDQRGSSYGPSIKGIVVDERGTVLEVERSVTSGANFARSFSALSLGDRVILVWADDHLDNNYELYLEILDAKLNVLVPRFRLSSTASDTLSPVATLGPNGDLGVLYDEWQSDGRQTYFLAMSCVMAGSESPPK